MCGLCQAVWWWWWGGGLGMPGQSTPPSYCVCTPLAWRAPLPPPSQVPCVHCVWLHLVYLSYTYVLHTPHGHPHVQPTPHMAATGPCGSCVTMPAWACHGVCCGGFVQAHTPRHHQAALTYMIPTPMSPHTHARAYGTTWRAVPLSCPSNMSTVRCAYHGKAPARAGMVMQRALSSAKCPAQ
jgi:hypothetical protein